MNVLPDPEMEPTVDLWPTAAQALGVGRVAVYQLAQAGDVPGAFKIGKRWRVATATLRDALGLAAPKGSPPEPGPDAVQVQPHRDLRAIRP